MVTSSEPRAQQIIAGDPFTLLELAAAPFLTQASPARDGPFASPACLLILRQGGLREDLFTLAARRGLPGWFDPPVCVFHELPMWLGATDRKPLGDFERAALLEHLLRGAGGRVFRGREGVFVEPVGRLFGELTAEAVTAGDFAQSVTSLTGREEFQVARDAALRDVYQAYLEVLASHHRRDGRDTIADVAAAVRCDPEALALRLGGRREIRILGLADLRGGWRHLLEALAASPAVDRILLYGTAPLPVDGTIEESQDLSSHPVATVIPARDEEAELESVAARIRALIDGGASADRIAVVSREARPYVDLAIKALSVAGIPAAARRRIALAAIPAVRAVLALLDAAASGWTRHALAGLGAHPYGASVDTRIVNYIGYRRRVAGLPAWMEAFDLLLDEARAAEAAAEAAPDEERRPRSLPAEWVERARERFGDFTAAVQSVDEARPLAAWLTWLDAWLAEDPWGIEARCARRPGDRWDVIRLDLLGWTRLRQVLAEWADAERAWPGDGAPLSAAAFAERLRIMLAGDIAVWTDTPRGVTVAEALAASHRSFDHVFLVGMNAGRFPRRAPSSLLLAEHDRDALRSAGLPLETPAEWAARERALWTTLVSSAKQSLTLTYRRLDELGGPANPSAFVDGLAALIEETPSALPVCRSWDLARHASRVAEIERERSTGRLSPWNGLITAAPLRAWLEERFGGDYIWSPTSLEAYAKCPWSWFSERLLRLTAWQDPKEDMDAQVRGSVLHDALHRFYDGARLQAGGPVFLRDGDREWALPLLRTALRDALADAGERWWLGHPALKDVKQAELWRWLERFLDFEIRENENSFNGRTKAAAAVRTAVESHEVTFIEARLEREGTILRYRGIVDRIEVGRDDRAPGDYVAAVDYKATKYAAPGAGAPAAWDDGVVLQVPLYAHALAQLRPGCQVARVEYRAVKQAERLHQLNLVRVKRGSAEEDPEATARAESALTAAVRHARSVRAGAFPALPAPSCGCPPFCHGWDICRVAGGPDDGRDA